MKNRGNREYKNSLNRLYAYMYARNVPNVPPPQIGG
uniref:Uncharacterized protein n=1 Tax=Myoviridae sp. ctQ6D10 TaxID=2827288 RepID=A0A8S5R5H2_9CAUD|nr:MAG TPA: hypothetical protein [Myoviridae sp. ctQ6D10]